MTLPIRQFRPQPNTLIKLALWEDYTSRNLNVWEWLRVISVDGDTCTAKPAPTPLDPQKDGDAITFPVSIINPPIGWKDRYTIYCKPEETEKVISWFKRGIVVRANHDLGSSLGSAFQPMDNADTPRWRYPNVTDVILPQDCARLFRVIAITREEIGYLRDMPRTKRGKLIRQMEKDGWKVTYIRHAGGFYEREKETIVHDWQES